MPAGTVSGAPKIRAMEIIDELENSKRKVYAGGIGYFSANGDFEAVEKRAIFVDFEKYCKMSACKTRLRYSRELAPTSLLYD